MRRTHWLLGFLLTLSLALTGRNASGAGNEWIERLSGPGPFEGLSTPTVPLFCLNEERDPQWRCAVDAWQTPLTSNEGWVFVTFTFSNLESEDNQLRYDPSVTEEQKEVTIQSYQFSLDYRLHAGLDVGVGLGFNQFKGDVFPNFWRGSFDPIRVVWRPIAFFIEQATWPETGAVRLSLQDLVQIKFRATHFFGDFTAEDFGALPGTFRESGEVLFGWAATIGVILAIGG